MSLFGLSDAMLNSDRNNTQVNTIYSLGLPNRQPQPREDLYPSLTPPDRTGLFLDLNRDLGALTGSWQYELYQRIIARKDTFVSVPPSAGKTRPVLFAWKKLFLDYLYPVNPLNRGPIPNILYIVPRKQLAGQINIADFVRNDLTGLADFLIKRIENNDPLFNFIRTRRDVDNFLSSLIAEMTGGGSDSINYNYPNFTLFKDIKPIIIATYEKAAENILPHHANKLTHIFVDEVQELIPHPNETTLTPDLTKRYQSLITALKLARPSPQTSITLMTGSVNQSTVSELVTHFNTKYRRQFEIRPPYNPQNPVKNRSTISIQTLDSLGGYPTSAIPNRVKLCRNIINSNQTNSIMIIFSKQLTGQGIFALISELIKQLPPAPIQYFYDRYEPYKQTDGHLSYLRDIIAGKIVRNPNLKDDDIGYLQFFDINAIFKSGENNNPPPANPDPNNLLYQGVLRGVAPLIGSMDQIHKRVVQSLFIKKKIRLLLATDALGVGANVECRHLYIPTINKFDPSQKRLTPTDESSLTQLVHRAGRGKFGTASVYCSVQDYDYINFLINNDPRSAVPQLSQHVLNQLKEM